MVPVLVSAPVRFTVPAVPPVRVNVPRAAVVNAPPRLRVPPPSAIVLVLAQLVAVIVADVPVDTEIGRWLVQTVGEAIDGYQPRGLVGHLEAGRRRRRWLKFAGSKAGSRMPTARRGGVGAQIDAWLLIRKQVADRPVRCRHEKM